MTISLSMSLFEEGAEQISGPGSVSAVTAVRSNASDGRRGSVGSNRPLSGVRSDTLRVLIRNGFLRNTAASLLRPASSRVGQRSAIVSTLGSFLT